MSENEVVGRIRLDITGADKGVVELKKPRAELERISSVLADVKRRNQELADSYKAIPVGIQRANDGQERLITNLQKVRNEAKGLSADGVNAFGKLRESIAATEKQAGSLTEKLEQAKKIQSTAGGFDDQRAGLFAGEGGGGGGGSTQSASERKEGLRLAINNTRYAVSDISRGQVFPALVNAQQAAAGFSAAGIGINTVTTAIAPFVTALVPVAPLLLTLGVGFIKLTADINKGKSDLDIAIKSLDAYYDAIVDGTTKSITEDIAQRQRRLDAEKKYADQLRDQLEAIFTSPVDIVTPGAQQAQQEAAHQLAERLKTLTDGFTNQETEINGLTRALDSSEVATNDFMESLTHVAPTINTFIKDFVKEVKEADEARRKRINGEASDIREQAQAAAQLNDLRKNGTVTEVQSAIDSNKIKIEAAQAELAGLSLLKTQTPETKERVAELVKSLDNFRAEADQLNGPIIHAAEARDAEAQALKDADAAAKEYQKTLQEQLKIADQYAATSRKIIDLDANRTKQLADQARTDSRNRQISALESQIAAAKEQEAEQQRAQKVVDLRKKAGQEELAAAQKNADEARKADAEFLAESMKAQLAFETEQLRAEEDYGVQRKRQLRDLTASLSELAAKGSVSEFISTQRSGVNSLNDNAEDQSIAARRRTEDFRLENEERIAQRDQRLAELKQGFEAERAQRQENLQQQLQAEQEADKQRLLQSEILEKQLSDLKTQFAAEDAARTLAEQAKAYADQRAALIAQQREQAELIFKSTDPVISQAKKLIDTTFDSVAAGIAKLRIVPQARPRIGGPQALANAEGGIYTRPTLGLLGEKQGYGDIVIPFRQSNGLSRDVAQMLQQASGGRMGGQPIININNPQFGAIATPADLAAVKQEITSGVVEGVRLARHGGAA